MQSYINIKSIHLTLSQFEARRATIGGIQISEGRRLVVFEFEARRAAIGEIQISEGLRLIGFKIPSFVPRIYRSSEKTREIRV